MRHPKGWKAQAGGHAPVVPHHPIHHGRQPHKKPQPPAKAHKKPAPAKKPKKPPAHKPARKWSPGWDVACCSAEAVGLLLGLSDAEVLELYWLTADDPDAGASIEDTLRAYEGAGRDSNPQTPITGRLAGTRLVAHTAPDSNTAPGTLGLILGVRLAEPHAVAVTPDGTWWSWGEPFNPADWPDLVIEEAWCLP